MQIPSSSVEREGPRDRAWRFVAIFFALILHVGLTIAIAARQFIAILLTYPQAFFRPKTTPPLPERIVEGHFENATVNQFAHPRAIRLVEGGNQIAKFVLEAEAAEMRVHAIGSGHSFSDAAIADETLIDLRKWNARLDLSEHYLRDAVDLRHLVRVASGITIRDLNENLRADGLALPNMGGYDGQTLAGAISTGTHGSGIPYPPLEPEPGVDPPKRTLGALCDMVQSLDLVTEGGRLLRIEPKNGISDPVAHAARFTEDLARTQKDPKLEQKVPELIQDDALFHSAVVSLGCMGIVHSYVLEVCERYLLGEQREVIDWEILKQRLILEDLRPGDPEHRDRLRHFEFLVSPYREKDGKRWCLATYRWKVKTRGKSRDDRKRAVLPTIVTSIREFDEITALALTVWPHHSRFIVENAIKTQKDDLYVDESYRVLNIGDANYVPSFGSELAFPADKSNPNDVPTYVKALERIFELAEAQARRGRFHNAPISVRYVDASPHFLAMSHGQRSAIFEFPMLARVPGGWDLLRFYERVMWREFRARAHWGQANFVLGADRICDAYGAAFRTWLRQYSSLCSKGTFDNSFSERMGLRTLSRAIKGDPI